MTSRLPPPSVVARRRDTDALRRALMSWEEWDALHPEGLPAALLEVAARRPAARPRHACHRLRLPWPRRLRRTPLVRAPA